MTEPTRPADPMASYILHLWARKWWIVGLALLAAVATAALAKTKARPFYAASAQVLVKERPLYKVLRDEERKPLSPVTYRELLLSDALLEQVRAALAQPAAGAPAIETSVGALQGACDVNTELIIDTTVERTYSPILALSVRWATADGARQVMDAWLRAFIARDGSLLSSQMQARVAALDEATSQSLQRLEDLSKQTPTPLVLEQEAEVRSELATLSQKRGEDLAEIIYAPQGPAAAYEGADVKVVAEPITPEAAQRPSARNKTAAVAGVALCLMGLVFIFEKYLREARKE